MNATDLAHCAYLAHAAQLRLYTRLSQEMVAGTVAQAGSNACDALEESSGFERVCAGVRACHHACTHVCMRVLMSAHMRLRAQTEYFEGTGLPKPRVMPPF